MHLFAVVDHFTNRHDWICFFSIVRSILHQIWQYSVVPQFTFIINDSFIFLQRHCIVAVNFANHVFNVKQVCHFYFLWLSFWHSLIKYGINNELVNVIWWASLNRFYRFFFDVCNGNTNSNIPAMIELTSFKLKGNKNRFKFNLHDFNSLQSCEDINN